MATTKKLILERQARDIEGVQNFAQLKMVFKKIVKEIINDHKNMRNDILSIEKRLDDAGL
jgi:hypothetical protein